MVWNLTKSKISYLFPLLFRSFCTVSKASIMMVNMTLMRMNEQEMAKQKNMTAAVREFSRIPPNLNLFSNIVKLQYANFV